VTLKAKATLFALVAALALGALGYALIETGDANASRLYANTLRSPKELKKGGVVLGEGRVRSFKWYTDARGLKAPGCFDVFVIGPVELFEGHRMPENQNSESLCGLREKDRSRVITVLTPASPASPEFDIVLAVFKRPVDRVRVVRASGGSVTVPTSAVRRSYTVPGLLSVRYATFGVSGCIAEVLGLEGKKVASRWVTAKCDPADHG
jgi:hypothetical protein